MFSSISSNVTSWLGGTQPDDSPQEEKEANAQSPDTEKAQSPLKQTEQSESGDKNEETTKPKEGSGEREKQLQDQLDEAGAKAVNTAKEWGSEYHLSQLRSNSNQLLCILQILIWNKAEIS